MKLVPVLLQITLKSVSAPVLLMRLGVCRAGLGVGGWGTTNPRPQPNQESLERKKKLEKKLDFTSDCNMSFGLISHDNTATTERPETSTTLLRTSPISECDQQHPSARPSEVQHRELVKIIDFICMYRSASK